MPGRVLRALIGEDLDVLCQHNAKVDPGALFNQEQLLEKRATEVMQHVKITEDESVLRLGPTALQHFVVRCCLKHEPHTFAEQRQALS